MEANRFVSKKNRFNRDGLEKHEGIKRMFVTGERADEVGAMSIEGRFDRWPCGKKDWGNGVKIVLRAVNMPDECGDDDDNALHFTKQFSIQSINTLISNLVEVRDELVALDNEVCEAYDIIEQANKEDNDDD